MVVQRDVGDLTRSSSTIFGSAGAKAVGKRILRSRVGPAINTDSCRGNGVEISFAQANAKVSGYLHWQALSPIDFRT